MTSLQQQEVQIRKRVACEERAFNVVLRLLDNPITEDYLVDACQLITPSHYSDVVEERSIAKLCGYPLCGNTLDNVPKQRYQISTKNNMVYDITERKKFCSNLCLKSSQYLEKQISTSPVWAREHEPRVNFEFLQIPNKSCSVGDAVFLPLPQTEVKKAVQTLEKLDKSAPHEKRKENSTKKAENVSSEKSSNLLSDVVDRMAKVKISYAKEVDGINVDFSEEVNTTIKSQDPREIPNDDTGEITHDSTRSEYVCMRDSTDSPLTHNEEIKINEPNSDDRIEHVDSVPKESDVKTSAGQQKGETTEAYVMRLLDRKKHLLGQLADIQQKQGETPLPGCSGDGVIDSDEEEENAESSHFESTKSDEPANLESSIQEISPQKLTKSDKLTDLKPTIEEISTQKSTKSSNLKSAIEEISPQKAEAAPPGSRKSRTHKGSPPTAVRLKPLNAIARVIEEWLSRDTFKLLNMCPTGNNETPSTDTDFDKNYANLCRRVAEDERDFQNLLGEESVEDSTPVKHLPMPDYKKLEAETLRNELRVRDFYRGSAGSGRKQKGGEKISDPVRTVQLPVVDSHDQMTIRRKIVLDRLNKVIPDILTPLRLSIQDVSQPIRELVFTFSFSSKNILFKPGEWSLVGILVLKLLSLKSKQIELSFKEDSAIRYFQIILSSLGHDIHDLDEVLKEMISFDSQEVCTQD